MPRIRPADGRTEVLVTGRAAPLTRIAVVRAVEEVLAAERRRAVVSVTFVGRERMRALNARWTGTRRPTDVLAFALPGPGRRLAGDVYICSWYAAREARARRLPVREELLRLVVHGTLHVLGWDHPAGEDRTDSPMWRRQERYVETLR